MFLVKIQNLNVVTTATFLPVWQMKVGLYRKDSSLTATTAETIYSLRAEWEMAATLLLLLLQFQDKFQFS